MLRLDTMRGLAMMAFRGVSMMIEDSLRNLFRISMMEVTPDVSQMNQDSLKREWCVSDPSAVGKSQV